jgi:hypothetical protein
MSNDWANKALKDLVAGYAADVGAREEVDRKRKEEADRKAKEAKDPEAKAKADEDARIDDLVRLVAPVLDDVKIQLRASKVEADVIPWWTDKLEGRHTSFPTPQKPDRRMAEKLIEPWFGNLPKDPVRRSLILFCAVKYKHWPPGKAPANLPEDTRDGYALYAGPSSHSPNTPLVRYKEGLFLPFEGMTPLDKQEVEWMVKETFGRLTEASASRCPKV